MAFQVTFTARAERQFRKFPRDVQDRLAPHIDQLREVPHPPGSRKLQGDEGLYRIRIGDYRVICTVEADEERIVIAHLGRRDDVYRKR